MRSVIFAAAALAASPATAEVVSADATGFDLAATATVPTAPAETWNALVAVGRWWASDHTYSGDAANMTIEPRAGGCFCEAIPDNGGSVDHGRVVLAWPGRTLRLVGGLGPLQSNAATAVLSWSLEPVDTGTRITMRYSVDGRIPGGADAIAPLIDRVLTEQLERLRDHLAP